MSIKTWSVSRITRVAKSLNFHTGHWKRSAGSVTHWFLGKAFYFRCWLALKQIMAGKPSSAEVCPLQTTVYDQIEETSSKVSTEAAVEEHRMQRISAHICVIGGGYVEAICLLAEENCLTVSLIRSSFCFFFLWLQLLAQFRKCGDAQLVRGCFAF